MSKPGPKGPPAGGKKPPAPNWLLMVAYAGLVFVMLKTCAAPAQKGPPPPTVTLDQVRGDSAQLLEATAAADDKRLTDQLDQAEKDRQAQIKAGKLDAADAAAAKAADDRTKVEAGTLVADAYLRAAAKTNVYDKFNRAYTEVFAIQRDFGASPLWTTRFSLPDQAGGVRSASPADLYQQALDGLSSENRRNLVWGLVPGYKVIDFLVSVTGRRPGFSYWFAPFLLALLVRAVVWPLTQKQLMIGRRQQKLAPMLREIKEKTKGDQAAYQKKSMELYREYGINPLAGCGPALVQLPFFWLIYGCMIQYRFEFQRGTFLWVNKAASAASHGFFAANLGQKDVVLVLLYSVTMLSSMMLMPVSDPTQIRQTRTMNVIAAVTFPAFMLFSGSALPIPAAFVLYWTFTNLIATAQSLRAYYLLPAPPLVKVQTQTGGAYPTAGKLTWFERLQEQMQAKMDEQARVAETSGQSPEAQPKSASNGKSAPSGTSASNGVQPTKAKPKSKPKRRT